MPSETFSQGPQFTKFQQEYADFCKARELKYLSFESHKAWAAELNGREDLSAGAKAGRLSVAEILINRIKSKDVDFKGRPFSG